MSLEKELREAAGKAIPGPWRISASEELWIDSDFGDDFGVCIAEGLRMVSDDAVECLEYTVQVLSEQV